MARHTDTPRSLGLCVVLMLVSATSVSCQAKKEDPSPTSLPPPNQPLQAEKAFSTLVLKAPAPYIPPQCYTRTQDERGDAHNPCFTCHNEPQKPNYVNDADLQLSFSFPKPARDNPWANLFVDRRAFIKATSDQRMLDYVRDSNYSNGTENYLKLRLEQLPSSWDRDRDGRWGGYVPDAGFRFDEEGFDKNQAGELSGWRAYAYYPFPGTFWPTNGSAGDALIRLPKVFRRDERGKPDRTVYKVNLAIVEALTKKSDVEIDPVDERLLKVDLDKNGTLGNARRVVYDWAPRENRTMSYVGQARIALQKGEIELAAGLLPTGTELLHSVRYLDVVDGRVKMAARMKELRYARKVGWRTYSELELLAETEAREKHLLPDRVRKIVFDFERGASNKQGWRYQGFIEDAQGKLRPQTFEETAFCVGCHGGTSATTDGVFSFARKLSSESYRRGWHHFSQRGLEGLPDRKRADGRGEYEHYLEHNAAGDELRANTEVLERFFERGKLRTDASRKLRADVSQLILPSPERALALNKAYWAVVHEQSFIKGRDSVLSPAVNIHRSVEADLPTGVKDPVSPSWKLSTVARR